MRDHLQAVARQTGTLPEQLQAEPLPAGLLGLWQTYCALRRQAAGSGLGAGPVTFEAIEAWGRLGGVQLTPWEVETLTEMDAAALEALSLKSEGQNSGR